MPLSFDHYSSVGDYFFTTWNWPLIRQVSSFFVVAALIGAFGVAITMIVTLPKACDPQHSWWSSATVYEIFPASFKVSAKNVRFKGEKHLLHFLPLIKKNSFKIIAV